MLNKALTPHPFHLMLQPLLVGRVALRNRVVMGSMHTGLQVNNESSPYKRLASFYAQRAKGQVGLIITGGFAPNKVGMLSPHDVVLQSIEQARQLRRVTDAVHTYHGKIILQMLHAGRYGRGEKIVSASSLASPVFNTRLPISMTLQMINNTVNDYVRLASLAREAGFDGVQIMASQGYLLNQFIAPRTNKRNDEYGGSFQNRIRFPLQVLRAVRAIVPNNHTKYTKKVCLDQHETLKSAKDSQVQPFLIIFRLSVLDLVPDGSTQAQVIKLAHCVAQQRADIINTGIGWHESRVPTIATSVPRGGFTWATHAIRSALRQSNIVTPIIAVNRVNKPQLIEQIIAQGDADLVAMARPFLTDAQFVQKVIVNQPKSINVCIGCNQACLDHIFVNKVASCMLNPQACHETIRSAKPVQLNKNNNNNNDNNNNNTNSNSSKQRDIQVSVIVNKTKHIAIVGGGPAGSSCAITLARRGHTVTLFEKSDTLGGQFNLAKRIPGKAQFQSAIDYWTYTLQSLPNVHLWLNTYVTPQMFINKNNTTSVMQTNDVTNCLPHFDEIIVATGCEPRPLQQSGIHNIGNLPNVFDYVTALMHPQRVGNKIAIIGAGGIGYDMAQYLASRTDATFTPLPSCVANVDLFLNTWGIDKTISTPGGLLTNRQIVKAKQHLNKAAAAASASATTRTIFTSLRQIYLFQRSNDKFGVHLGPTTGWIHRLQILRHGVRTVGGVQYKSFDGKTFQYVQQGKVHELEVNSLVLCTGQKSNNTLLNSVLNSPLPGICNQNVHGVGGCVFTKRLDAVKAILHAHELALTL